jgi:hypothetical protein
MKNVYDKCIGGCAEGVPDYETGLCCTYHCFKDELASVCQNNDGCPSQKAPNLAHTSGTVLKIAHVCTSCNMVKKLEDIKEQG